MLEQVNGDGMVNSQICILCDWPADVCTTCDATDNGGRDCNYCDHGKD
jgi:hypothetical protein